VGLINPAIYEADSTTSYRPLRLAIGGVAERNEKNSFVSLFVAF